MIDASSILTAMFFIMVIWGALRGLMRGFGRQAVHTVLTIVVAVISFVSTLSLSDKICSFFTPESIKGLLENVGDADGTFDFSVITEYLSSVETLIKLPVGALITPIIFMVIFVLLNSFVGILNAIVCAIFGIEKPEGEAHKTVIGGAIGLAEGLIIAIIFFLPFANIFNVADRSVDAVRGKDGDRYNKIVEPYDTYCGELGEHFAIKLSATCGKPLLDKLCTAEIDGHNVNLRDECVEVADVVIEFYTLGKIDYSALTEDNKAALRSAVTALENSEYLTLLMSGIFRDMGRAFTDGVVPVSAPAPYDVILNPAITMFATSDENNFRSDVDTLLDVYFILSDSGVLKAFGQEGQEDAMRNAFILKDENGETTVNKVVNKLNQNEHMSPIVKAITDMSLIMLTNQLGVDANIAETYDSVKNGMQEVIAVDRDQYGSDEEYEEARNTKLNETLTENNINLSDEEVDGIGDYIDEHYGEDNELTDEEFNDIIFSYYDVYLGLQGEGSENP
ncbi:MAG: CvpA family protein [Ruminococcaceae bacterium]|nr:CvpA family protein [Oscillospiraceae bacterium]